MENGNEMIRIEHLRKSFGENEELREVRSWSSWDPAEVVRVP